MPFFHLLNGSGSGRNLPINETGTLLIGQSDAADIQLSDSWISWEHARLTVENGAYFLEDLDSTNGTFVNCRRVEDRVQLQHEDIIFFGRTHALFLLDDTRRPATGDEEFAFSVDSDEGFGGDFEFLDLDDLQIDN